MKDSKSRKFLLANLVFFENLDWNLKHTRRAEMLKLSISWSHCEVLERDLPLAICKSRIYSMPSTTVKANSPVFPYLHAEYPQRAKVVGDHCNTVQISDFAVSASFRRLNGGTA